MFKTWLFPWVRWKTAKHNCVVWEMAAGVFLATTVPRYSAPLLRHSAKMAAASCSECTEWVTSDEFCPCYLSHEEVSGNKNKTAYRLENKSNASWKSRSTKVFNLLQNREESQGIWQCSRLNILGIFKVKLSITLYSFTLLTKKIATAATFSHDPIDKSDIRKN